VKTFLASLGGALAMLLLVATWQARTSASQFVASAPASWAPAPAISAAAPSNIAMLPQGVVMATPSSGVVMAAPSAGVVPIAYTPSGYQPVASNLVQLDTPRAVPVRYVTSSPRRAAYRETKPRRNWVKTALVIGGSAGAGAGIGALAGGKKGALVGAAVGGGAASLFEAFKR
jgi:hypothetical protein